MPLPKQTERLISLRYEFFGRDEFELTFIAVPCHDHIDFSIWKSMEEISKLVLDLDEEVIIICRDDHMFTKQYKKSILLEAITNAASLGASILLGRLGDFRQAIPLSSSQFWIGFLQVRCERFHYPQ